MISSQYLSLTYPTNPTSPLYSSIPQGNPLYTAGPLTICADDPRSLILERFALVPITKDV